ncbi:MAG: phosphopantothenoylcysteine decarboxylase [Phycisphaerales bacterium]
MTTVRTVPRLLVTAGPTQEPIDAVRYIGNRSSGRMGWAIARAAAEAGHPVTLLFGPGTPPPADGRPEDQARADSRMNVVRFRSTADLEAELAEHWPAHDVLIMAAAVADYRPIQPAEGGKLRRTEAGLTIELESTPDLLAGASAASRPDQTRVGFALEPRDRLDASARAKLVRKDVHAIVANPLETMDASTVEGVLVMPDGVQRPPEPTMDKQAFARWLIASVVELHAVRLSAIHRGP